MQRFKEMLSVNKKKVKPGFFTTFYIINLLTYIMKLVDGRNKYFDVDIM